MDLLGRQLRAAARRSFSDLRAKSGARELPQRVQDLGGPASRARKRIVAFEAGQHKDRAGRSLSGHCVQRSILTLEPLQEDSDASQPPFLPRVDDLSKLRI